jgi:hypothetical protein
MQTKISVGLREGDWLLMNLGRIRIGRLGQVELHCGLQMPTEGADWQRHRKITAPPFNEKNSG